MQYIANKLTTDTTDPVTIAALLRCAPVTNKKAAVIEAQQTGTPFYWKYEGYAHLLPLYRQIADVDLWLGFDRPLLTLNTDELYKLRDKHIMYNIADPCYIRQALRDIYSLKRNKNCVVKPSHSWCLNGRRFRHR